MLKSLIDFNYFRTIAIGNDNVMDLIAIKDYLQIHVDKVKKFCFSFLQSSMKRYNCLGNVDTAAMYRHKLYNNLTVQRFMSKDFSHIRGVFEKYRDCMLCTNNTCNCDKKLCFLRWRNVLWL